MTFAEGRLADGRAVFRRALYSKGTHRRRLRTIDVVGTRNGSRRVMRRKFDSRSTWHDRSMLGPSPTREASRQQPPRLAPTRRRPTKSSTPTPASPGTSVRIDERAEDETDNGLAPVGRSRRAVRIDDERTNPIDASWPKRRAAGARRSVDDARSSTQDHLSRDESETGDPGIVAAAHLHRTLNEIEPPDAPPAIRVVLVTGICAKFDAPTSR